MENDILKNLSQNPQFARFGRLASEYCNVKLPLQVLQSARGHYIGTFSEEGPVSRESVEYWDQRKDAETALANGTWTQKPNP